MPAGSSQSAHGEGAHSAPATPLPSQPSTDPPHALPDDDLPYPPRFWWLKRLSIASGMLFVVLILLRLWWGWEANRRLQAEIAKYRAAGEPVFAEEFDAALDAVPPEENAALLYEQAAEKLVEARSTGRSFDDFFTPGDQWRGLNEDVTPLLAANASTLSLMEAASIRASAQWPSPFLRSGTGPPFLPKIRSLQSLLFIQGQHQLNQGDLHAALRTADQLLRFGRHLGSCPSVFFSAARWRGDNLAMALLCDVANKMHTDLLAASLSRDSIHHWIRDLFDETQYHEGFRHAFRGDRALLLENLRKSGPLSLTLAPAMPKVDWALRVLASPLFTIDGVRALHACDHAFRATLKRGAALSISDFLKAPPRPPGFIRRLAHPISIEYNHYRIIQAYLRTLARRRLAATSLAILLYEMDRNHPPASLNALVPDYLPALPVDPLSPTALPLRLSKPGQRLLLYSVGLNGQDDRGESSPGRDDITYEIASLANPTAIDPLHLMKQD